jgi:hypothetical protein
VREDGVRVGVGKVRDENFGAAGGFEDSYYFLHQRFKVIGVFEKASGIDEIGAIVWQEFESLFHIGDDVNAGQVVLVYADGVFAFFSSAAEVERYGLAFGENFV